MGLRKLWRCVVVVLDLEPPALLLFFQKASSVKATTTNMGVFLRRICRISTSPADTTQTHSDGQTVATSTRLVVGQDNTALTTEIKKSRQRIFQVDNQELTLGVSSLFILTSSQYIAVSFYSSLPYLSLSFFVR